MLKIKTKNTIKLKLFDPINIVLLVSLSTIDNSYLEYPEDNLKYGSIMQILTCPSGVYLEYSGRVYLSEDSVDNNGNDIEMIEGIHFNFI